MAKGKIVIRADRCKGCEICAAVCPKKLLKMEDVNVNKKGYHPICITREDQCIACANCAVMCPDGVINVYAEEVQ